MDWKFRAAVQRVIDGDTVELLVDLGFRARQEIHLRLVGIDAPEVFSGPPEERLKGEAAKRSLMTWIASHTHDASWPFIVHTLKDKRTFNRYLGVLECTQGHKVSQQDVSCPSSE